MIQTHLKLKGLTCFADEIAIDFTAIPPGLIAIVGENGTGKTTLMEAPVGCVYGELPTRGLVGNYATHPDSFIETGFEFDGGERYRARRTMDAVKGGGAAILERVDTGTRLNDGKVTTFKAAAAKVFPSLEALLASSFAAQNRAGSFATRSQTERKNLFSVLLGLHRLDAFASTSRAAAAVLDKALASMGGRRDALLASTSDALHDELQAQAYALTEDIAVAEDRKATLEQDLATLDAEIASHRTDVDAFATALAERAQLDAKRSELASRQAFYDTQEADAEREHENALKGIRGRLQTTLTRIDLELAGLVTDEALARIEADAIAAIVQELQAFTTEREARIAKNSALKAHEADVRAAVAAVEQANTQKASLRQELTEARAVSLVGAIGIAERRLADIDSLIGTVARHRRSADLLTSVPCGGEANFTSCQFLKDAAASSSFLDDIKGRDLAQERTEAEAELMRATDAVNQHRESIANLERRIDGCDATIATHQRVASQQANLKLADERIAEYGKDIEAAQTKALQDRARALEATQHAKVVRAAATTRLTAAIETAKREASVEEQALTDKTEMTRQRRAADLATLNTQLAEVLEQLAASADVADAHAAASTALTTTDAMRQTKARELTEASTAFARVDEQITHLRQRQDAFKTARAERDHLDATIAQLETDLIDWQVLAQLMGREGLPVLEIDAAGPGVSAEANDLLQASFGGRFVVELVTQEAKADGKGLKEVFELKVYDHERGGEARDLADLSGGEQVIVDEALKSAIALFVNRRNERPIRTCWRDETTGALDPENALRYVAMLRRLHERAGLHHLLFVSHNPEVSALADVQLQIADGQVHVVYPPFNRPAASQEAA